MCRYEKYKDKYGKNPAFTIFTLQDHHSKDFFKKVYSNQMLDIL